MRHSYLLLLFLVIFNSCKEKSNTSGVEKKTPIDSLEAPTLPKKDSVKTSKNSVDFIIRRHMSKEANILPLGDPNVKEIKSAIDTISDVYGEILVNTNKSIDKLDFKDCNVGNTESLMEFIRETKDSLNRALYHDYYSNKHKLKIFEQSDLYFSTKSKIKIFFLKSKYFRTYDNDKMIENIYLLSFKDEKIADILNIYYHAVRTHSMDSRFFYIDKDAKITSAIYSNIEGEISVRGYKEFMVDKNGFFQEIK